MTTFRFRERLSPGTFRLTLLGTGTSHGVPMLGCRCEVCQSNNPHNQRLRSGVLLESDQGSIVIDTSADLRTQLLREHVEHIDAALFTHIHADHILGLDDLRIFSLRQEHKLPLYGEPNVGQHLQSVFDYAFEQPSDHEHKGSRPRFAWHNISPYKPFHLLGLQIHPLRVEHGRMPILGYRIGPVAFCTDVSHLPTQTMNELQNLEVLILGALRYRPHPTHLTITQAKQLAAQLQPQQCYLTHFCHDIDHQQLSEQLPAGIAPAYDGLSLTFSCEASGS